jgi:hypothetical protein
VSYDVTFGYAGPEYSDQQERNYTSNVAPMWHEALGESLGDLIERCGKRNADLIEPLARAVAAMEADAPKYQAMNPSNGWGHYDGALAYLRWMLTMCRDVPEGKVEVWR